MELKDGLKGLEDRQILFQVLRGPQLGHGAVQQLVDNVLGQALHRLQLLVRQVVELLGGLRQLLHPLVSAFSCSFIKVGTAPRENCQERNFSISSTNISGREECRHREAKMVTFNKSCRRGGCSICVCQPRTVPVPAHRLVLFLLLRGQLPLGAVTKVRSHLSYVATVIMAERGASAVPSCWKIFRKRWKNNNRGHEGLSKTNKRGGDSRHVHWDLKLFFPLNLIHERESAIMADAGIPCYQIESYIRSFPSRYHFSALETRHHHHFSSGYQLLISHKGKFLHSAPCLGLVHVRDTPHGAKAN